MTDILDTIDETLTFYSTGLGTDLKVPVERGISLDDLCAGLQSASFAVRSAQLEGTGWGIVDEVYVWQGQPELPLTITLDNRAAVFTPSQPILWRFRRHELGRLVHRADRGRTGQEEGRSSPSNAPPVPTAEEDVVSQPEITVRKLSHPIEIQLLGRDEQGRQLYRCPSAGCGETAYFDVDGKGHCPVDEAMQDFLRQAYERLVGGP